MKRSPFQLPLWWLLTLVVVAALDCAALRSPLSGRRLTLIMNLLGVLPMANLLFLGLLVSLRREGRRLTFWVGFELAGLLVLLIYIASTISHSQELREVVAATLHLVGPPGTLTFPAAAAVLLLPQVLLAFLGGCLSEHVVSRVSPSIKGSQALGRVEK
jgi:hypothetical protein